MNSVQPPTEAILSLHRLTVGNPTLVHKLLRVYGSADKVLADFDLQRSPVSPKQADKFLIEQHSDRHKRALDDDLAWQAQPDQCVLVFATAEYPDQLLHLPDPPLALFVKGHQALLSQEQIAIVGSRRASPNGLSIAEKFASELAAYGFVITSGMALGIDAAAHRGTLAAGGATIAVQAIGAGNIYPRRHEKLAVNILKSGCLVTEFPTGVSAHSYHFPQRNRIVTGLSRGTLVVEASQKSGSLISARLAMEQGKEVFAVPGPILSQQSEGCHQLIRQGAKLTASIADIVEEFHEFELKRHRKVVQLSQDEELIMAILKRYPCHADRLHEETKIAIPALMALLIGLEIKGEIESGQSGYRLCNLP